MNMQEFRVPRLQFGIVEKLNFLSSIKTREEKIKKVLEENPETIEIFQKMLVEVLINYVGYDFYRMKAETFAEIQSGAENTAKNIVAKIKNILHDRR